MGKFSLTKNNYDVVCNRYQGRLKEIKDIIKLMTLKYENELDYGKSMKKLSETSTCLMDDWYILKMK